MTSATPATSGFAVPKSSEPNNNNTDPYESVGSTLAAETVSALQSPSSKELDPSRHGMRTNSETAALRAKSASFVTSLPLRLDVKIPIPDFRFKDLAFLRAGQILKTDWQVSEDLPVAVGDVRLLWAEFSVAEQQLTVRVTRVA